MVGKRGKQFYLYFLSGRWFLEEKKKAEKIWENEPLTVYEEKKERL
jgi:hypothetical protein